MGQENKTFTPPPRVSLHVRVTRSLLHFLLQKNKNKKKGKDEKCGSEVTTPENSSSPGMMDMHGEPPPAGRRARPGQAPGLRLSAGWAAYCLSSRSVHIPGEGWWGRAGPGPAVPGTRLHEGEEPSLPRPARPET